MGLFNNPKEQQRLLNLQQLEDKRLIFARELKQRGINIDRALLVQTGGGFKGIGMHKSDVYLLEGPAPGEDADFKIDVITGMPIRFEPFVIPSEGGGGLLGFGKKGGHGYLMCIGNPDGTEQQIHMVSALQCIYEEQEQELTLLSEKRRKGNANFVWDFTPIQNKQLDKIVEAWKKLV